MTRYGGESQAMKSPRMGVTCMYVGGGGTLDLDVSNGRW